MFLITGLIMIRVEPGSSVLRSTPTARVPPSASRMGAKTTGSSGLFEVSHWCRPCCVGVPPPPSLAMTGNREGFLVGQTRRAVSVNTMLHLCQMMTVVSAFDGHAS